MSRAQRNDADVDMKQLLEQVTVDLLLVHNLPEWPAALPMLLRLVTALLGKAGMHSPDNAVRSVSVDLLGLIAAQLCYEAHVASAEAEAVADIVKEHGESLLLPKLQYGNAENSYALHLSSFNNTATLSGNRTKESWPGQIVLRGRRQDGK